MNDYTKRITQAAEDNKPEEYIDIFNSISLEFSNFIGPMSPVVVPFLAALFKKYLSVFEQQWPGSVSAGEFLDELGKSVSVVVPHHRKED